MTVTARRPHARAWARVGNQRSIVAPRTPLPVSAATPSPYPGIVMRVPRGITEGSTATTPQPTGIPVEVCPGSEYPVELRVIDFPPEGAAGTGAAGRGAAGTGAV